MGSSGARQNHQSVRLFVHYHQCCGLVHKVYSLPLPGCSAAMDRGSVGGPTICCVACCVLVMSFLLSSCRNVNISCLVLFQVSHQPPPPDPRSPPAAGRSTTLSTEVRVTLGVCSEQTHSGPLTTYVMLNLFIWKPTLVLQNHPTWNKQTLIL